MKRTITMLTLALGVVVHGVQGCGINWSLPKNHFDGVNEFGFVSIWQNIGDIDVGGGLNLPLNVNFRSDRSISSSTLGSGWHLALLDANIVQIDERTFMMFDPAGPFRLFWRDAKNPNVLSGQAGWKAEIQGDSITAWSDCGVKLVFNRGRIASMQLKDKVLTYSYQNGQVAEIRDGNTPILKVDKAPITGEITGLTLANNQQIRIERGDRPRVQVVNNQQLVSGMDPSLSKVTKSDGTTISFEYAVDQKLNPTLKLGDRLVTWNPATKMIISDGDWVYDIKPSEHTWMNAAIGRKNKANQEELWFMDSVGGQEIIQSADGLKKVKRWFTSGDLFRKPRSVEVENRGKVSDFTKFSYDDKARLLRKETPSEFVTLTYNDKDKSRTETSLQKQTGQKEEKIFDSADLLLRKTAADGNVYEYTYDGSRRQRTISKNGHLLCDYKYQNGSVEESVYNLKTGAVDRIFLTEIDKETGQKIRRTYTEYSRSKDPVSTVKNYLQSASNSQ